MVKATTQASNSTGLALAREVSPGVVDMTVTWYTQEPNTYKDFGGQYKSVTRNPINADRQNQKGVIVDLDANGGWQEDLTYESIQNKLEGVMYADFRKKAETADTSAATSDDHYVVASSTGIIAGDLVSVSGFTNAANNGLKHVTAVATGTVTVAENLVDETGVTGKMVKIGHRMASGDVTYTNATTTLASTVFDFTTLGLIPGEWVYLSSDTPTNDLGAGIGIARILTITAHALKFDKVVATNPKDPNAVIVDAPGTAKLVDIIFGRVIKNEKAALIKRYTYQAERTLGMADSGDAFQQAEYIGLGVLNECTFAFNTADKVTADITLLAGRSEVRNGTLGPKPGLRPVLQESSAFNTVNDVKRMSVELVGTTTPLYAYVMDLSIMIKNNAKANKAIGVLGAFGMTEGQFMVSASATAYFTDVNAAAAISQNSNVTVDVFIARDNHGIVFDIPLVSLSDGRPKITANEPIQLPLSIDAATAKVLNPNTDYTFMMVFFDYLPNVAMN